MMYNVTVMISRSQLIFGLPKTLARLLAALLALLMLPALPLRASGNVRCAPLATARTMPTANAMTHMKCCKPGRCRCCVGKKSTAQSTMVCGCGVRSTHPDRVASTSYEAERLPGHVLTVTPRSTARVDLLCLGVHNSPNRRSLPQAPPPRLS